MAFKRGTTTKQVRDDREEIVQTPVAPVSYDDRVKANLSAALGDRRFDARDPQTREIGSTEPFGSSRYDVAGKTDRYGTAGTDQTGTDASIYIARPGQTIARAEVVQKKQGIKGAETGEYRSGPIGPDSVVQ